MTGDDHIVSAPDELAPDLMAAALVKRPGIYMGLQPSYERAVASALGMEMSLTLAGDSTNYSPKHSKLIKATDAGAERSPEEDLEAIRTLEPFFADLFAAATLLKDERRDG